MTLKPFFPDLAFAWAFYAVLTALLILAACIDWRRLIVPKWLSLTTLGVGLACNLARGAWMGGFHSGEWGLGPGWGWAPADFWLGAADGLLFTLAGFCTGFGIFFVLWALGACGGDVKLFAAVSAWVGPYISLWILALSTVIQIMLLGLKLAALFLVPSPQAAQAAAADKKGKGAKSVGSRSGSPRATPASGEPVAPELRLRRGVTYSLPLTLATALALLWFFRGDLNLAQTRPRAQTAHVARLAPSDEYSAKAR